MGKNKKWVKILSSHTSTYQMCFDLAHAPVATTARAAAIYLIALVVQDQVAVIILDTRFPSGKRLGEWRKNETKSIQRETNTTTPEIEE